MNENSEIVNNKALYDILTICIILISVTVYFS